ncbi:replication-associated protein [Circoviridae 2 LDMD-2013]|uniref:replication-associated protein n=1 Tax=Circoviridae 2 LDMD-2013 TaxID=1379695 RepID=UPI0003845B94|nr:replication-associated protein [Circoviridae 2 LDMD-2013]AGS36177.1 replication-associated protein [Circoviridae 2 LDMD-2013]
MKIPDRSRHRAYCITLNNYFEHDRQNLETLVERGIAKYVCFQPEKAPGTGTRHIQGYVVFQNARTFSGAKAIIGEGAHIEVARGSSQANIEYCSKDESRDTEAGFGFIERGNREDVLGTGSGGGTRTDLAVVAASLRTGATLSQIAEDHPASYIMYTRGIHSYAQLSLPKRSHKTIVHWYWGPTGTGKTRLACEESPDAYWKSSAHQWYDGYDGLADIIIDDYRCSFSTFNELLRLLDRYPYQAQVKGGTIHVNAKRIFITAPKDPRSMWQSRTEEDIAQLERRIEVVRYFGVDENIPEPVLNEAPAVIHGFDPGVALL